MNLSDYVLEMNDISKAFNKITVLDKVELKLKKGEVLGLVGENGAGKSTLVKILCGNHRKDAGEIKIEGKKIEINDTLHAKRLGISIIYQELSLFPDLNAIENIFIQREKTKSKGSGLLSPLDKKAMEDIARKIFKERLHVDIDLISPISKLSLSDRQLIEIARALHSNAKILIMDEPTASLSMNEKENLFTIIEDLKKQGTSIIFISHHLDEIICLCDRIMVLRDGKKIADEPAQNMCVENMISLMIGKELEKQYPKEEVAIGGKVLQIKNLSKSKAYEDITFSLHKGEILGITGLAGCGNHQLVRSIFGIDKYDSGEIILNNERKEIRSVNDALNNKIAFLPAERKVESCFLEQSLKWNMTIASLNSIQNKVSLDSRKENTLVTDYIKKLRIKTSSDRAAIKSLSGGNQQKVIFARWFITLPDILILVEPTRGIDVNSKKEVYKLIIEYVKEGKSVILVSSEEEEVLGICDSIIVMNRGRISANLTACKTNLEEVKYYSQVKAD